MTALFVVTIVLSVVSVAIIWRAKKICGCVAGAFGFFISAVLWGQLYLVIGIFALMPVAICACAAPIVLFRYT